MVAPIRPGAPGSMPAGPMNLPGAAMAPGAASPDEPQGYQSTDDEKALAKRFKKRIKFFRAKMAPKIKRWKENREYVDGEVEEDGSSQVRVNLVASVVNTIQPNIYAKAPEVSVQPQERIDQSYPPLIKGFARTMELALNRFAVRDSMLKVRGKEAVRSSLTCTTGWVKVIYQRDIRQDPVVVNRINDQQENLARLETLLRETQDEAQCQEYEAKRAELQSMLAADRKKVDVVHADGIVIDNVKPENMLILDDSVTTIDEYAQASEIAHGIFMTVAAYKSRYKEDPPKGCNRFNAGTESIAEGGEVDETAAEAMNNRKPGIDDDDALVLVWEIWSKTDQTIYTQCDGADEFCKEPFQPETLGAQWYGFFPLQLWRVTSLLYARALVDQLRELVDEYNTRRTNAKGHRRKNMPVRLLNTASGMSDADVDRINKRSIDTDVIGVNASPDTPLQNQLGSLPEIPYNPAMYDTTDILRDIEMVSGAQDASRGGVNQAKTATEAEIMAMGMQSRTAEQLDTIEDWLTQILIYCAQLLLLNKQPEEIQAAFGPEAVWPQLTKEEMFKQVDIVIRAGSTAKPNKMRERDQWLQFLPQLQQALAQIGELRAAGHEDMADAMVKVLDESLRRFDERLSIKDFIPGMDGDEDGQRDPQAGLKRQMQAAQEQLQQMMAEAQQVLAQREQQVKAEEDELYRNQTALQVKQIQFKAQEDVASMQRQFDDELRKITDAAAKGVAEREQQQALDAHMAEVQAAIAAAQADQAARDAELRPESEAVAIPPEVMQAVADLQAGQQQQAAALEAMAQQQERIQAGLQQVAEIASRPRTAVIVRDPQTGRAVGARAITESTP